jgi:hypothetical protein
VHRDIKPENVFVTAFTLTTGKRPLACAPSSARWGGMRSAMTRDAKDGTLQIWPTNPTLTLRPDESAVVMHSKEFERLTAAEAVAKACANTKEDSGDCPVCGNRLKCQSWCPLPAYLEASK